MIPTQDRWARLARAGLASALCQEGLELEVVVVDDGSVALPHRGMPEFDDPRVRVVRLDSARGVAAARNAGVDAADGEWIALLDDDDLWAPDKLRRQLAVLNAANADYAYSGVVAVDSRGHVLHRYPVPSPDRIRLDLLATCAISAGPSNVVVRASLIRALGGFDEQLAHLADWDCWIRMAWAGEAAATHDVLVAYVEHLESMSSFLPRDAYRELAHLEQKHRQLRIDNRVDIDRVAFAHYVAWLQLRRRRRARAARLYLHSAISNRRPQDALFAARFALRALVPIRRTRPSEEVGPQPELAWIGRYGLGHDS